MKRLLILTIIYCLLTIVPSFGAISFSYTEATNTVEATGGDSTTPATFNDMYTADKAGTATLLASEAFTQASAISLDYAVRPTDATALTLTFVISGSAGLGAGDTIDISGDDWDGVNQTESIVIAAGDGSYPSSKKYSTIDAAGITFTDNAGGGFSGNLVVTQPQWGVVNEIVADGMYKLDCNIDFGDGAMETHFLSKNEAIYFSDGFEPSQKDNATVTLGVYENGSGEQGSYLSLKVDAVTTINNVVGNDFNVYGSTINTRSSANPLKVKDGTWVDSLVDTQGGTFVHNTCDITRTGINGSSWQIDGSLTADAAKSNINVISLNISSDTTFSHMNITKSSFAYAVYGGFTATMKDDESTGTITPYCANAASSLLSQYTCNIHVADEDGAALEGVTVACTTFGSVVSNDAGTTFYKCVEDHTADVFATDVSAGKWEVTTAAYAALAGCTGAAKAGAWVTGIDYKASATEFSTTTDSNGDTNSGDDLTIDYKKWIGTSEALLTYGPHTFTFSYGGDTHVKNDVVIDHPIVWHIEFPPIATMMTAIYNKLPSNNIADDSDIDAAIAALHDFDPASDTVARVTLVDTTTTNTDMRGTDSANTTVPDVAGTAAALHAVTDALISALNNLSSAQAQAAAAAALTSYDPVTRAEATADKDEVIAAVGDITVDNAAIADAVLDELIEGTVTLRQATRLFLAVLTGKTSGGGTTRIKFYDLTGTKVRLDVTVDSRGNRTAVNTRDGS